MKLVYSPGRNPVAPAAMERHAADLAAQGVDCLNLHHSEWTRGLVALFHRFGLATFAWDTQETRYILAALRHGHRRHLLRPRGPHGRDRRRVDRRDERRRPS